MTTKLLSHGSTNYKINKGSGIAETYSLNLSPHKLNSFGKNLCAHASEGCTFACINTAGRGAFSNVQQSRIRKTDWYISDKVGFLTQLYKELYLINAKAQLKNEAVAIRLNCYSDLDWFAIMQNKIGKNPLEEFKNLKFYDYTPNLKRAIKYLGSKYHLTFSRKENNDVEVDMYLKLGGNVAVVFDKLPTEYNGYKVIDGDENDLRYLDPKNVIVGLKVKGKGKKDDSGFVIKTN